MTNQAGYSRSQREQERADMLFMVYKFMGPGRSLMKLLESCTMMGLKISEKTLKRYSVKYEWQRRILQENAKEKETTEKSIQTQVEKMNTRHAQFAQGLFGAALAGLNNLQQDVRDTPKGKVLSLNVREIVDLFKASQQGERLARGQATSRIEVWVDIVQTVVKEFGLIFLAVNQIPDDEQRQAEYIRLSDEMITRYFSETTKQVIELGSGNEYKVK
ncbi:hypothetical protein ACFLVS_00475 [Chloroflexota bacterium]